MNSLLNSIHLQYLRIYTILKFEYDVSNLFRINKINVDHIIQYQYHPTWINDDKIYQKTHNIHDIGIVMYEMIQFYIK